MAPISPSDGPSHLIERAAERLRGVGGLTAPPAPLERTRLRTPPEIADGRTEIAEGPDGNAIHGRATHENGLDGNGLDGDGQGPHGPGLNELIADGMAEPAIARAGAADVAVPDATAPDTTPDAGQPVVALADGAAADTAVLEAPPAGQPVPDQPPAARPPASRSSLFRPPPAPKKPAAPAATKQPATKQPAAQQSASQASTAARAEAGAPEIAGAPEMIDFPALEKAGLVVGRKTRTRISEEFRISVGAILRTIQTAYSSGSATANLLMITSARPGEGKSFSALNIAGSIAQHGQREVLLVDVDAKQRPITHQLGLGEARGLLDLAANPSLRVEDVIIRTAIPNLSIIPIGNRSPETVAGSVARPVSAVIERLGRRFASRVIILDAPPCLSTSDPSALAPLVGQIIMVVEAERTQRNEVEAAFDLIKSCPTVTLLLNKIQLTTSYTFGAYHYFGSYS